MENQINSQSAEIKNIVAALCKFQATCPEAQKTQDNPHFKSKYAGHSDVMKAVKIPLAENGLSISQRPCLLDTTLNVTTYLFHTSGEWLSCVTSCKPKDLSAQTVGSALTYLRRYGINAILNIATGEDDDGNAAQAGNKEAAKYDALQKAIQSRDAILKKIKEQSPEVFANAVNQMRNEAQNV